MATTPLRFVQSVSVFVQRLVMPIKSVAQAFYAGAMIPGDIALPAPGPNPLAEFIRLNRWGTVASAVLLALVNVVVFQELVLYAIPAAVMVTFFTLIVASRLLESERVPEALGVVAFGNWMVAVVTVSMVPWVLPVMVLTAMMPIALATPYVERDRLWPFMLGTAAVLAAIGWLGIERDDSGVVEDVADGIELGIVVLGLICAAVPIGVVVWQANRYHRAQTDAAVRLSEQLSESRRRLVVAGDAERARIERDLHDGAQQRLIAIAMRLRMLNGKSQPSDLTPVISDVETAMADIRRLANGIAPALLESAGLQPALAAAARDVGLPVETNLASVGRLDRNVETALYFCGTEAMQNALKHADGQHLRLDLFTEGDRVVLEVSDEGPGFDPMESPTSSGMVNMSDRMASIGGTLTVTSRPGGGTTVCASVLADGTTVSQRREELIR